MRILVHGPLGERMSRDNASGSRYGNVMAQRTTLRPGHGAWIACSIFAFAYGRGGAATVSCPQKALEQLRCRYPAGCGEGRRNRSDGFGPHDRYDLSAPETELGPA